MSDTDNKKAVHHDGDADAIDPVAVDSIAEEKAVQDKNVDPALEFVRGEVIEYDEAEAKSVLSKIDWALMPLLCWIYALQFADKTSLNYASLMGIREDTNLDPNSQQYSWASSIFYAGYIMWEYVRV